MIVNDKMKCKILHELQLGHDVEFKGLKRSFLKANSAKCAQVLVYVKEFGLFYNTSISRSNKIQLTHIGGPFV